MLRQTIFCSTYSRLCGIVSPGPRFANGSHVPSLCHLTLCTREIVRAVKTVKLYGLEKREFKSF